MTVTLMLFTAFMCFVGALAGPSWARAFWGAVPGESLLIGLGLLSLALLLEFFNFEWFLTVRLWFDWRLRDFFFLVLTLTAVLLVFYMRIMPAKSHNLKSIYFVPHIFTCLLGYVFFVRAAFCAVKSLACKDRQNETEAYRLIGCGLVFYTVGMLLGSCWARQAWGQWWSWDPKEAFSLGVWFVLAASLVFRAYYKQRFLTLNCLWVIIGFVLIVWGVTVVNFSRLFSGLHSYAANWMQK